MMADELLNAQDLITAKKHDTFHSEVITGKTGGLSTGANIDYATNAVTGQVQKTLPATVNGIDWTPVGNLTTDNCTFTKATDYAVDDSGTQWAYNGTFPFTSTAPVVPSAPDYYVVHVRDHNSTSDRNAVGAHDAIYRRKTTVSEIGSGVFSVGDLLEVSDRAGAHFDVVAGGTPNGYDILDAGGGNTAQLVSRPTVKSFGGGGLATPSVNANVMEALLAYGTTTGKRIYSGDVGAISLDRNITCELDGRLDWLGEKSFLLVFQNVNANAVDIHTRVGEGHSAGVTLDGWNTKGGGIYGTRIRAGDFGDNLTTVVDNVEVKNCYVAESGLSGLYLYHCQNVSVHHNIYHKCGDNGAYIAFCRAATAHHNYAYNCRGSAGITMGYSDTVKSTGLEASHNIIWNDDLAASIPTAVSPTTLGGVWMGHCENGKVHSNTIFNLTNISAAKIKHGIWVDENTIKNIVVEENIITNMPENGIWVGSTANAIINDVYVNRNHIKYCRDGIRVTRGGDVYVTGNIVKFASQRGILAEAGSKSVTIDSNKLIVCGQQDTFNTYFNVDNLSDRPVTTNNTFDDTIAYIVLKDPGGTVTVKVDAATSVIEFFVSGVPTYTVTVDRKSSIWGDIHLAIIAIPELSGSLFVGNPNQIVETIKRTGPPNLSWSVEESANDYVLSFSPPWGYIRSAGRVHGNELVSRYMSAKITSTNLYNTQKPCSVIGTPERDTNDFGGARKFVGAAAPTVGFYRLGDTFGNAVDGGTFSARCTVSGYPGTWV